MKHFKRLLAGLIIASMMLIVLSACSQQQMESAGEVTDFSSEKHFGIDDIIQNGDESEDDPTTSETESEASVSTGESSSVDNDVTSKDESKDESLNAPSESSQSSPSETSKDTTSKPSETSKDSTSKPSETSKDTTTNPSQGVTGEFVVSDKKYDYNGRNIMLLQVENKTNKDFDVTIKGKYLDKNGKVIKEESQTYRGFPTEWKNYFIFHPRMAFDKFEYTIEVKEFKAKTEFDQLYLSNGELLSKYVELTFEKELYWMRGGSSDVRDLVLNYRMINRHKNTPLTWQGHLLVLDENGEIYATDYDFTDTWPRPEICFAGTSADPIGGYRDGISRASLRFESVNADLTIPDSVQGKLSVIFAVRSITNMNVADRLNSEGKLEGVEIEGFTIN